MFRRIVLAATLAGLLSALALTLAQALWVTPLILDAETYEGAAAAPTEHEHGDAAWQPENGWQRTFATAIVNGAMGWGYGLMLAGLFVLRRPNSAAQGVAWGLAGYTAFFVAPALGLPPELPGTEAAELAARQHWWLGTVVSTATGLALLAFPLERGHPGRLRTTRIPMRMAGLLLLAAPHLIGAPEPPIESSLAPASLQTQFRVATLACNALFWLLLGATSAVTFRRFVDKENG